MIPLPFPLDSPDEVVEAVLGAITPRTRLLLISHGTSSTGLMLPLDRLVPTLEARGIMCLVDGAHGLGFVDDLDLAALGASFYTTNLHKWLCAPKGSAVLHIRPDRQDDFRPLALSNEAERPRPGRKHLLTEFDYAGTADPTPYLAAPMALATLAGMLPGGLAAVMRHNRELCRAAREHLCGVLGLARPAPESMLGPTATLLLPANPDPGRPTHYADPIQDRLIDHWRIQAPVWSIPAESPPRRLIRISAQLYNTIDQYRYLAGALAEELELERRSMPR